MPITTNLDIPYPSATALVSQGFQQITDVATSIDAFFGAPIVYTPTFGNVTSGAGDFRYRKIGRLGFVIGQFSGGTATATGNITVSLPTGWTNVAVQYTVSAHSTSNGLLYAICGNSLTYISIFANTTAGNWTAGSSLASVRFNAVLQLA